jgi:uncharacterized protein YegL
MKQTDTTQIAKRVLNLIILDESGSMHGLEKASVDGVNETIQTIKSSYEQLPEQEQLLTFVTFSGRGDSFCRTKLKLAPISHVSEFKPSDYQPSGNTPLYDTMGLMLTEMEEFATDSDVVLVTIITDGYENASREYSGKMIHDMVERLDHEGWVFAYIGANQDAMNEAYKLGIRNSLNFAADEEGTKRMWKKERSSRLHFLSDASKCDVFCESLKENYFSKSDAEDFEDWN